MREENEPEDELRIPKRSKICEVWDDFEEFEKNGSYFAICQHCKKKEERQSKQVACGGTRADV